jgi:Tfp pilus assembly protein PilO
MLEELETLSTKLAELATHVRVLKDENAQLRAQSVAATAELANLRARVTAATQRMDALLVRLPQDDESAHAKAK